MTTEIAGRIDEINAQYGDEVPNVVGLLIPLLRAQYSKGTLPQIDTLFRTYAPSGKPLNHDVRWAIPAQFSDEQLQEDGLTPEQITALNLVLTPLLNQAVHDLPAARANFTPLD